MKKNLLTGIAALTLSLGSFSQTIPNGGFEGWTVTPYDMPQFYVQQSANFQAIKRIGMPVVTKIADPFSGSYAIKFETKTNGVDTVFGYFINGQPCGPTSYNPGGIPYTQNPTGLTGHYKCGVPAGDTAIMIIVLKKNGVTLANGFVLKKFFGTQSTYAPFTIPISVGMAPDTVIIGAASSNVASGNFKGIPGSFLQLDSINFKGVVTQPLNLNGSFELWNTNNIYNPAGWSTSGDSITRSTSAFSGSYALLLQVQNGGGGCGGGGGGYYGTSVTSGSWAPMGPTYGGYPYTLQNDSLIGYYKFAPQGGDTAYISWQASKTFTSIGGNWWQITAGTGGVYKRFSMPITLGSAPDTLRIDIGAGKWPATSAMAGTKLWIDGLQLKSSPLSVGTLFMSPDYISVFPNPSKGLFNLVYDSESTAEVNVEVMNETGQVLMTRKLSGNGIRNEIDLTSYGAGLYLIKTIQDGKVCTKRLLIQ